jgi:LacI family transcriptional regulator
VNLRVRARSSETTIPMSTILDVAKLAGVSHATVTRYFHQPERLRPETRRRVEGAVKELRYVPNAAARSLISRRSRLAALIVTDISSLFHTSLIAGAEDVARNHGYTLVLANTGESIQREREVLEAMISHQVDGVILTPATGDDHLLDLLAARGVQVVLADRQVPGAQVDTVLGDSYEGGRLLTEHLIEQGFRRIAFVGGQPGASSLEQRLAGYRDAMNASALEPLVHLGRYDSRSGEEIVDRLVAGGDLPEAAVAASSKVALGVLVALRRHGFRVPHDIALASMDDIEAASMIDPFLTVAAQPATEIGQIAMEMLLERIGGRDYPPRRVVLPVKLIVRRSSLADGGSAGEAKAKAGPT